VANESGDRADPAVPAGTSVEAGTSVPAGTADPGTVPSLSPSRASDFMTCPLLYRFRVIDRLP